MSLSESEVFFPLYNAIASNELLRVKELVEVHHYDVNGTFLLGGFFDSPFALATAKGNIDIMDYLLSKGADINHRSYLGYGWSPLEIAVYGKNFKSTVFLLQNLVDVPSYLDSRLKRLGFETMRDSLKANDAATVHFLLNDPLKSAFLIDSTVLNKVIVTNYFFFEGREVRVESEETIPLRMAVDQNNLEMVFDLLEHGATPSLAEGKGWENREPLVNIAIYNHNNEMAKVLIDYGADIDASFAYSPPKNIWVPFFYKENHNPLTLAIKNHNDEMVKWLLESGANVNPPSLIVSPLHRAVLEGNEKVVQLLVERGADVNAKVDLKFKEGYLFELELANRYKMKDCHTLDYGPQVKESYSSVLGAAVLLDEKGIVKILVENGAIVPASLAPLINTNKMLAMEDVLIPESTSPFSDIISSQNLHHQNDKGASKQDSCAHFNKNEYFTHHSIEPHVQLDPYFGS